MKVNAVSTACFFEAPELRQELILDALDFFVERVEKVGAEISALFPADPYALPFTMYLSDRLSVPLKTESFLKEGEPVLMVFSFAEEFVSENYLRDKVLHFRRRFRAAPSLLVGAPFICPLVDFQLIKAPYSKVFSYRFTVEAFRNFFYPVEGELTHFSPLLWELSKQEVKAFEKSRRIRENAKSYLNEETAELKLLCDDAEIAVWERFRRGFLVVPQRHKEEAQEGVFIKHEKLLDVEDPKSASAVTSLIEYLAQGFELRFPTFVAYSSSEIVDREGVTLIPRAREEVEGIDLKLEVILRSKKLERDFRLLVSL